MVIIIYRDVYYIKKLREFKLDINNEISGNISKQFWDFFISYMNWKKLSLWIEKSAKPFICFQNYYSLNKFQVFWWLKNLSAVAIVTGNTAEICNSIKDLCHTLREKKQPFSVCPQSVLPISSSKCCTRSSKLLIRQVLYKN